MPARSGESAPAGPEGLKAPLFGGLMARVREGGRWVVLDLGASRSGNIELFSSLRCRLDIADLASALDLVNADVADGDPGYGIEAVLPPARGEAVDLVLCWDLLNYLARPSLQALTARLAARARPGMRVHALIAYAEPKMPARPSVFSAYGPERLRHRVLDERRVDAPRYAPKQLLQLMPGFEVERALLLGNGMQEYVFRFIGPAGGED